MGRVRRECHGWRTDVSSESSRVDEAKRQVGVCLTQSMARKVKTRKKQCAMSESVWFKNKTMSSKWTQHILPGTRDIQEKVCHFKGYGPTHQHAHLGSRSKKQNKAQISG